MSRYLTKSRFKLTLSCPTKLFFKGKDIYPDLSQGDEFLEALAEGGYQVGALAKCYFPGGIDIQYRGYEIPLQKTNELLKQIDIVIFEAAFKYQNLFIRADIIEKHGNHINLIEVKAKSFGGRDSNDMLSKRGFLESSWKKYIYDVAFQKYVVTQAFPGMKVSAYLMLADKNAVTTVNSLNQKFQLKYIDDDITYVEIIGEATKEALGDEILIKVNVDDLVEKVYDGTDSQTPNDKSFIDRIHFFADNYEANKKIRTPINKD